MQIKIYVYIAHGFETSHFSAQHNALKYISLDSDAISTIYLKILARKHHKQPFLSQVTAGKPWKESKP